jgi:K(+)-stimulated pyrophosphate-energized sodium pump
VQTLFAEGGYQSFNLGGGEWATLALAGASAVLAILVGMVLMRSVTSADAGTQKMQEIAHSIQEGAMAYLSRQFRTIAMIVVPVAAVVFFTSTQVLKPDETQALSFAESGLFRTLAFVAGGTLSALVGFIGMSLAVRGNVRTAAAARQGSFKKALDIAFRTGGVAGLFTVGLGLGGAVIIIAIFQNSASAILVGFGFGGSLLALFLRVGGGIFTKAADVGADLVGKVEAGIPEDDARNPATIADNVGDNVGDCAGMASDLFESYLVTLVASIILGVAAFTSIGENPALGLIFPVAAQAIGIVASIIGILCVRANKNDKSAMAPINRGFLIAGVLAAAGIMVLSVTYIDQWKVGVAVLIGLVLGQVLSRLTGYFTGTEYRPVQEIAEASKTGPATNILSGLSSGLESAVYAVIAIAAAIGAALWLGNGEGLQYSLYLIALAGTGMLATTGIVVAEDTFGPVSDNSAGIAEMAGEFEGEPQRILVSLDAVGNTTKAVTKGFAIGSAVIAALALFASYIETIGDELNLGAIGDAIFTAPATQINVADPKTFIGLLIGGSVGFLFSALTIRAVGRSAGVVVDEVRRQFREKPGIMNYTERPEYGRVIDICTGAALRELATPALLAVLTPAVIGFGLGYKALGAFLVAAIATGALLANFLSNAGGAWDNGKKFIEDLPGGKGSDQHKAAVIGDTVGDPFKDTSGPALNPLIKVMNLVSLLLLPAIINLEDNTGARIAIIAVSAVILIGAVAFSKRPGALVEDSGDSVNAIGGHANLGKVMADSSAASPTPNKSAAEHPELIFAIDKVMVDLRHDTELVEKLRAVKEKLK